MQETEVYKRNYHPLIILFYVYGMLDSEQIKTIPRTTRYNWNNFHHKQYDLEDWVQPYLQQFDDIQKIYLRKQLHKTIAILITISDSYHTIISQLTARKKFLKQNTTVLLNAIDSVLKITNLSVKRVCRFYGVSKDWYYREKNKIYCPNSMLKKCFKQYPNQLLPKEVETIQDIISQPLVYGTTKTTLYYKAMREGILQCAKSTFCKYATALGYKNPKRFPKPRKEGLKATRILEWLHVDITYVSTLNDGLQKVAFVKDTFSKAILHYSSTDGKARSSFIKNLFVETFEKHKLHNCSKPINILSDGGSENKGDFLSWIEHIQAPPAVTKITARTSVFPFSNSMSESTHSIYKTEFLQKQISVDKNQHLDQLETFVTHYNQSRYPTDLYGLTPHEVLQGASPDKHRFKNQLQVARKERIAANQSRNNCLSGLVCATGK